VKDTGAGAQVEIQCGAFVGEQFDGYDRARSDRHRDQRQYQYRTRRLSHYSLVDRKY